MIVHTELFGEARRVAISIPSAPRSVLMIAYSFPPEAYVGGRRTLKYCKYLGQYGWRPIVITIKPRGHAWQDDELVSQIPSSVEVCRTMDVDAVEWLERIARWTAPFRRGSRAGGAAAEAGEQAVPSTPIRLGRLARLKGLIARALLDCPDPHILWVPIAFLRGVRVLLTRRVDVIYSSSPPHSSHLAAALLAFCFRKPHVIDLRDPWIGATAVKRRIMRRAARVIVVSPGEPGELAVSCPGLAPDRLDVITNGYDPDDFRRLDGGEPDAARITLTHAGTIYRETGREFFTALERLLTDRPGLRALLRVNLIGDIDPTHAACVRRLEATGVVSAPGCLGHRATLECLQRSDALIILARGGTSGRSHIPAKVFEYLYARKPILALAEEGSLTGLLRTSGLGIVVPPDDAGGVERAILRLCGDLRAGDMDVRPNQRYIGKFDRRVLTGRFAAVLDGVTGPRRI
jgi:glycosyltransferase involved in cell wall biosynthesis